MRILLSFLFCISLSFQAWAGEPLDTFNQRLNALDQETNLKLLEAFGAKKTLKLMATQVSAQDLKSVLIEEILDSSQGSLKLNFEKFEKELDLFLKKLPFESEKERFQMLEEITENAKKQYALFAFAMIQRNIAEVFKPAGIAIEIVKKTTVGEVDAFKPAVDFFTNLRPSAQLEDTALLIYRPESPNMQFAYSAAPGLENLEIPISISLGKNENTSFESTFYVEGVGEFSKQMSEYFFGAPVVVMVQEVLFDSQLHALKLAVVTEELSHYYDRLIHPEYAQLEYLDKQSHRIDEGFQKEAKNFGEEMKRFVGQQEYQDWLGTNLDQLEKVAPQFNKEDLSAQLGKLYFNWSLKTLEEKYGYYFTETEYKARVRSSQLLHNHFNLNRSQIIRVLFLDANQLVKNQAEFNLTSYPQPPFMQRYFKKFLDEAKIP